MAYSCILIITISCLLGGGASYSIAQNLDFIPPVINGNVNNDTSTSILLTTADQALFDNKPEEKRYTNTVQIVDADQSWPPRWYASSPVITDAVLKRYIDLDQLPFNFFFDARIQRGLISVYKIQSAPRTKESLMMGPDLAGYILLNKKMRPIDTVKSNVYARNLYYHDMYINENGERLVNVRKDTYSDMRDFTRNPKDFAVYGDVDLIQILDRNDNLKFTWNPMDHLDPEILNIPQKVKDSRNTAFLKNNPDEIQWTELTSAIWDYDGNIVYALKEIGLGKISRWCSNIMWQINYKDIPFITGTDTLEWHSPHDLRLYKDDATSATYTVYSNGQDEPFKRACGVVFQLDKKTENPRLVKYVYPQKVYRARGQGSFDYNENGYYMIAYGNMPADEDNRGFRDVIEYGTVGKPQGFYQLPPWNYVYKAHRLEDWPRPPRPVIVKNGNLLETTADLKDLTWYKLSGPNNTNITKAGTGKSIPFEAGANYCVEGKYGMGYVVSRAFSTILPALIEQRPTDTLKVPFIDKHKPY
jgi:hypothetical protein